MAFQIPNPLLCQVDPQSVDPQIVDPQLFYSFFPLPVSGFSDLKSVARPSRPPKCRPPEFFFLLGPVSCHSGSRIISCLGSSAVRVSLTERLIRSFLCVYEKMDTHQQVFILICLKRGPTLVPVAAFAKAKESHMSVFKVVAFIFATIVGLCWN